MEFLHYDIEVAVLVAVFYMFYRLLLSRENLHRLNRVVLIGTAVASLCFRCASLRFTGQSSCRQ